MTLTKERKESMYKYAKENLKRIPLDVQKEKYEEIKTAADAVGEKVNTYIKKAIDERMERDNTTFNPNALTSQHHINEELEFLNQHTT